MYSRKIRLVDKKLLSFRFMEYFEIYNWNLNFFKNFQQPYSGQIHDTTVEIYVQDKHSPCIALVILIFICYIETSIELHILKKIIQIFLLKSPHSKIIFFAIEIIKTLKHLHSSFNKCSSFFIILEGHWLNFNFIFRDVCKS